MSRLSLLIRVLIGLAVTYGCHAMPARVTAAGVAVHEQCGVVFIIGGVGGMDLLGPAAQWALPRAGIRHEVRDFVWTHGFGRVLKDLRDTPYLLMKAGELAAEVRRVKADNPDRPVYFVAKSGGTGVALAAAEMLLPATLERIILLSAAVSPTYDLGRALQATKYEIVSFYSPLDCFVLGIGTSMFGTTDRVHTPSAGLRRFRLPADADEPERVVQRSWRPAMILEGYAGNHCGTSMPLFIAKEVAPWLQP